MRSRLAAALALAVLPVLGIATAAAGASQSPAAANDIHVRIGQGKVSCPSGSVCLYENANYNASGAARILVADANVPDFSVYGFDDLANSGFNNSAYDVVLSEDPQYQGRDFPIPAGGSVADWSSSPFHDLFSSLLFQRR